MGPYMFVMIKSVKDLDYWKKKLIAALKIDQMEKSIEDIPEARLEKARGYAVGTVRTWGGKDFKKLSSGKWMRTYTGTEERGERQAVRNVMNKIQKAGTMAELVDIVKANRERFVDESGKQLPIVKEFINSARGTESGKKKLVVKKEAKIIDFPKKPLTQKEIGDKAKLDNQTRIAEEFDISVERVQEISAKFRKENPKKKVYIDTIRNEVMNKTSKDTDKIKAELDDTKKKIKDLDKKDSLSPIRDKYDSGNKITGDTDDIFVGKEEISGTWKLVEAGSPSASHDETNFSKTDGFPTNEDGSTINDRDYEKDKDAQLAVIDIASEYDGRALSFDSPVIVSPDGVVISGNNRTMSSKIAANKGTDKKYIEALKKRTKKFGFTPGDVSKFKNPRVVFEMDNKGNYSTKEFAKFNETSTKTMSPVESAVKMSKIITPDIVKGVAGKIDEFDTMGELYADKKAVNDVYRSLEMGGIVNQFTRPQYVTEDGITGAGKEFLETVLIGSVVNEKNIRGLSNNKAIRKKLVRAIVPLIENKAMGGYSVANELNNAIDIHNQVRASKDIDSVGEFAKQSNMFEETNDVSIELAKKMDMKERDFASFMKDMNGNLEIGASGQADIFFGDVESKDDILNRMLKLGKSIGDSMKYIMRKSKDLDYWKRKLLGILKEQSIEKSLKEILFGKRLIKSYQVELLKKARGYAVGTIREWGGKKYKKLSSGKWMRTYEKVGGRGERQAYYATMRKIKAATSIEDLQRIVQDSKERFSDEKGNYLPTVEQFMKIEGKGGYTTTLPKKESLKPKKTLQGEVFQSDFPATKKEKGKLGVAIGADELSSETERREFAIEKFKEKMKKDDIPEKDYTIDESTFKYEKSGHYIRATVNFTLSDKMGEDINGAMWDPKPTKAVIKKKAGNVKYTYGMNNRPPGLGTAPKGFEYNDEKNDNYKNGTVSYDRKLTEDELKSFEMTPIGDEHLDNVADSIIDSMGRYGKQYAEEKNKETLDNYIRQERMSAPYSKRVPESDVSALTEKILGKLKGDAAKINKETYESLDMRGKNFAIYRDGRVLTSGGSPKLSSNPDPIKRYLDMASKSGGELYISDKPIVEIERNTGNIMGMTFDQISDMQQGRSKNLDEKIKENKDGAILYKQYVELSSETERQEFVKPTKAVVKKNTKPKLKDFSTEKRPSSDEDYDNKMDDLNGKINKLDYPEYGTPEFDKISSLKDGFLEDKMAYESFGNREWDKDYISKLIDYYNKEIK